MAEKTFTDPNLDRICTVHNNNFLEYLSSAYEVLRKILSYLSMEDLENVSKAFERWRPIVETTKRERTAIESFVWPVKFETCEMWSEASFCITFCLIELRDEEEEIFRKYLKEDAQFIVVESQAGIIGTPSDFSGIIQEKSARYSICSKSTVLATHLRIPSIPGTGIKVFTWDSSISFEDFRNSFSLPENQIIKCLLILITVQDSNTEACEQKDDFVLFLQSTQSESFAVGGCLIDLFFDEPKAGSWPAITKYVIFYGDKVEAASTVLSQDVRTKEAVDSKVEELKMMCPKTKRGVLFVFRCCSRTKVCRQQKARNSLIKWEGDALTKCFPSTPIIGCFGYGEFGRKFPEKESPESSTKRSRKCDISEYSFSTSIVYVGFKN